MIRLFFRAASFGLLATLLTVVLAGQTHAQIVGTLQELQEDGNVVGIRLTVTGSLNTDVLGAPNNTEFATGSRLLTGTAVNRTYISVTQGELNAEPRSKIERFINRAPITTTGSANLLAIDSVPVPSVVNGPNFYFSASATGYWGAPIVNVSEDYVSGSEINGTYDFLHGNFGYYKFSNWDINVGDWIKNSWTIDGVESSIRIVAGEPINIGNEAPTADAGGDQSVRAGDVVQLDGSGSFDDNTASADLGYAWSFSSKPGGSTATLDDATLQTPSFTSDVAGTYTLELVVTDEAGLESTAATVEISTDNLAPNADAVTSNSIVIVNDAVYLDGSGSSDPENDAISYQWTLVGFPIGSAASITDPGAEITSLTPDLAGTYTLELIVSDLLGPSAPVYVTFVATTCDDFAETLIVDASDIVEGLTSGQVTNQGNQSAFARHLANAIDDIQAGETTEAIKKLKKSISRTDGCPLRGNPDGNGKGRDWITDCDAQQAIYDALTLAVETLENCGP